MLQDFFQVKIRPWSLLSAAGFLGCLVTLLVYLGPVAWFLDILAHFRLQVASFLFVAALLMGVSGRRRQAILFGLCACLSFIPLLPLWLPSHRPDHRAETYRLLLANVNTAHGNPQKLIQLIQREDPDLVFLEEVNVAWLRELSGLNEKYGRSVLYPQEDNFGLAFFSKKPLIAPEVRGFTDMDVPTLLTQVQMETGVLTLVGAHVLPPWGASYSGFRNQHMSELAALVQNMKGSVLVVGDLNATPWSTHFRRLLRTSGLRDSSRGRGYQATWPSYVWWLRIPIDHILHSPDLVILERRVGPDIESDHLPLIVDFGRVS